jgi:hypothetical protein
MVATAGRGHDGAAIGWMGPCDSGRLLFVAVTGRWRARGDDDGAPGAAVGLALVALAPSLPAACS